MVISRSDRVCTSLNGVRSEFSFRLQLLRLHLGRLEPALASKAIAKAVRIASLVDIGVPSGGGEMRSMGTERKTFDATPHSVGQILDR
jgi:hypothetical protein